ncbi:MAG TPA: Gfo/Idh/MocA family oxidoreductase [Anaerolineae bacterium]|nr:Gfo/Idh/MocA family oxidoreductase [Anaerolineae bacterium]
MTEKRRFNRAALVQNPVFLYLEEEDRYLAARPQPKYRFNIIGVGIMGQEHIRVTLMEGRATIHGIYDPNPRSITNAQQEADKYHPGLQLKVYKSLAAACHDPEVDGLIICTPNYTHIEVIHEAAASGKHILLEKPMATTVKDAFTIWQLAQKHPAIFQIGLQYRFKPHYSEAIFEVLERGSIGTVKTVSMSEHRMPFLDKVNQWNKFAKYSGDTLVEKCCHYFDLLNKFAGARPQTVYAVGNRAVNFTDMEHNGMPSDILDNGMVIITYENGVTASFNLCMFAPMFHEELVVCGDEGRLTTIEHEDALPHHQPSTRLEIATVDNRPSRFTQPMYPQMIQGSGHHGATYIEHIEFIDQIEGNESRAAQAEEGFWSIVVGAAAQASIATGAPINISQFLTDNEITI